MHFKNQIQFHLQSSQQLSAKLERTTSDLQVRATPQY